MLTDQKRAALHAKIERCPACSAGVSETNHPSDGIPSGMVLEEVYRCGAAVFITEKGGLSAGRACPDALEQAVAELEQEVEEEEEGA